MSHEQFVNGLAPWAAQYDTCLLIKLLQKGVVFPVGSGLLPWEAPVMIAESVIYSFSFLFFSFLFFSFLFFSFLFFSFLFFSFLFFSFLFFSFLFFSFLFFS